MGEPEYFLRNSIQDFNTTLNYMSQEVFPDIETSEIYYTFVK